MVDVRPYAPPGFKRAVVTGGLGFVGRHLVNELRARSVEVLVLDRAEPNGWRPAGVTFHSVDLRRPATFAHLLTGVDVVFHLAGNANGSRSVLDPRFDFESNAAATFNVCEALAGTGVGRLVYLSSAMTYGIPETVPILENHPLRPFLPYAASKLAGEHVVSAFQQTFDLPTAIGRAFVVYGPGEDPRTAGGEVSQFLRWHLNEHVVPVVGDIDRKTRDFIHVRDLVAALIILAEHGPTGETYNLGSGEEISLRRLASLIGEETGRPVRLDADDSVLADSYRLVPDITKIAALGYRPRTSLREGIAALAAYLGDRPELPGVPTILNRGGDTGRAVDADRVDRLVRPS